MGISAKEAATRVGLSKGAVINAIKSGKLSAEKDRNGEWKIEPVELFRVYQPVSNGDIHVGTQTAHHDTPDYTPDVQAIQREMDLLRQMLSIREDEVADLRNHLALANEEKQKLLAIVSSQMTPPSKAKTGWWQRLLGGGQ